MNFDDWNPNTSWHAYDEVRDDDGDTLSLTDCYSCSRLDSLHAQLCRRRSTRSTGCERIRALQLQRWGMDRPIADPFLAFDVDRGVTTYINTQDSQEILSQGSARSALIQENQDMLDAREEKKRLRKYKNRQSAQLHRTRKAVREKQQEDKMKELEQRVRDLQQRNHELELENSELKVSVLFSQRATTHERGVCVDCDIP